jgi:predicted TIM-barrel fold metal-dependent hydrolase
VQKETTMPGMNRRSFIASAGLLSAGAALPRARSAPYDVRPEIHRYRKIDCHCHVFPRHSSADVIAAADKLEIEKLAVSNPITTPVAEDVKPDAVREANNVVLRAMKEYPGRFQGQCYVNPFYGREALEEMARCLDAGMIGLGEMYTQVRLTDPRYFPIIEKCIELKAPLLSHACASLKDRRDPKLPGGSIADDFVEIGRRYPEALIIYGHIGGGGDWEYACKALRDAPSIFADTSGSVTDEGLVDFAVRCLGVRRLLFATDLNFETGVGKLLAAQLTEAERRQIFFDNFNGILRQRGNDVH